MKNRILSLFGIFAAVVLIPLLGLSSCEGSDEKSKGLFMSGTGSDPLVTFAIDGTPSSYPVTVSATQPVDSDIRIKLSVRPELVAQYNEVMGVNYWEAPATSYKLETDEVVIEAGKAVSTVSVLTLLSEDDFETGRVYIIPVTMEEVSGTFDVIESNKTIYLKVSRTLHFSAPYTGNGSMSYQFLFDDPVSSIPVFTYEVKILGQQFRSASASTPTRVCSFGGDDRSVEGGAIDDDGYKCDQILLRFGEGTDDPNILQVMTPDGGISANTPFDLNRWYHVAIVFDGEMIIIYIDGERDVTLTTGARDYSLYGVQIGMPSRGHQSSQLFYGRLSEMRLWTRPLTAREIRANFCGTDPETDGLLAYWRMNEGTGVTFYDSSPAGRHIAYTTNPTINWTNDDYNKCVE